MSYKPTSDYHRLWIYHKRKVCTAEYIVTVQHDCPQFQPETPCILNSDHENLETRITNTMAADLYFVYIQRDILAYDKMSGIFGTRNSNIENST
jgi:hypothetical protein